MKPLALPLTAGALLLLATSQATGQATSSAARFAGYAS